MRLVRNGARWGLFTVSTVLLVLAVLQVNGALGPTYAWFVQYFAPEVWSALAAWVAVVVGIATVVVAGLYAKQQVDKAQDQVREAQAARLAQERQSQRSIETQIRLANEALIAQSKLAQQTLEHDAEQAQKIRREQAQPNVVIYSELNPTIKQFIEIVVKNFGVTPAYNVKITIDPPLKATPNLISGDKLYEIPIPEFLILAPGQEWRTGWDHSVSRKRYQKKMNRLFETAESELTGNERLEKEYWTTRETQETTPEQLLQNRILTSRYRATVVYEDRDGGQYKTEAILDSDQYKGTTWPSVNTVHELTKTLDRHLKEQNKGLDAIHRRLAEFGTEHGGIWIYGSGDDDEREYRQRVAEAEAEQRRLFEEEIGLAQRKSPQTQEQRIETNDEDESQP